MTDKELKKLNRGQLLELLIDQSREIDRLQTELDEAKQKLEKRELTLEKCGSIAEASLVITEVFERAQEAADLYLEEAKRCMKRAVDEGKALPKHLGKQKRQKGSDK